MLHVSIRLGLWLILFILMGLPVLAVLAKAGHDSSWADLWTEATWTAFRNSVVLGVLVTLVSAVLAAMLASALSVIGWADHPLVRVMCLIPFMAPPYLLSIGWMLFMQPNGYLTDLVPQAHSLQSSFFSLAGLVWIMSLHLFPITFFALLQVVHVIQHRYLPAARVHGATLWYAIWRIWLPVASPYLIGSSVLVFVKTVGEFGMPLVFGSLVNFPVLTTTIYSYLSNWPIDFSTAARLSSLLLAVVFLIWLVGDAYRRKLPVGVSDKEAGLGRRQPGTAVRWGAGLVVIGLFVLSLGIPVGSLFLTSLLHIQGDGVHWDNLTWANYLGLLRPGQGGLMALWTSMKLSAIAATAALLLALALAVMNRWAPGRLMTSAGWLALLPNTIPDVLFGVGMIFFWNARWMPIGLYDTQAMLVVGFVVVWFPFAFTYIKAGIDSISARIWQVGSVHQGGRWYIVYRILMPTIATSMISAWAMVFGVSLRDLVVPLLLSPPNVTLVSTYVYAQYIQGSFSAAMALAMVSLVVTLAILVAVQGLRPKGTP